MSTLPAIEDDDETTSTEQTARTETSPPPEAPATATEPAPAEGNDAASFAARLKALLPDLKKAQALSAGNVQIPNLDIQRQDLRVQIWDFDVQVKVRTS